MSHRGNRRGGSNANRVTASQDGSVSDLLQKRDGGCPGKVPDAVVLASFAHFQQQIDAKNDKWERLVKCSRDVTIESKRVIFLLHRVTRPGENVSAILTDAETRLRALCDEKFTYVWGCSLFFNKMLIYF